MMTVADYIAGFLVSKGVKFLFGFQGSAMLKMLEATQETGKVTYVQGFNEQASAFAADAYARITNKIGVTIATSGPGAVNLIGGIADAFFDSVPLFVLTGQDYLRNIAAKGQARQGGFQDMDIVSMVKPVTKYAVLLDNPENVRYTLEKAFHYATTGRKGSVLIDVPIDVQFAQIDESRLRTFIPKKKEETTEINFKKIIELLEKSHRPVILAGGGIRQAEACRELKDFAGTTKIPVMTTLNGIDAYDDITGFSGLYGNTAANLALLNADLILALGTRFSVKQIGRTKNAYAPNANVIHVDIDDNESDRTFMKESLFVKADIKAFLNGLNKQNISLTCDNWNKQVKEWSDCYADSVCAYGFDVDPVSFVRAVVKAMPEKSVAAADVGANQMWTAQAFRSEDGKRLLNSAGFGAMGFALPAGIGAFYATGKAATVLTGDGGFQMNLQELNTLSLLRPAVKVFVFNNSALGLMLDVQKRYYHNHFYGNNPREFSCPDLKKLADTFNLKFLKITSVADFSKIEEVYKDNEPWLIDVRIDKDTPVLNRYDDPALRKRIYLDFDGTLINSQGRLYRLFKELCPECDLTEDEYNAIKRSRVSQKALLKDRYGYTDEQIAAFHQKWMDKVEETERVETDFPCAGMTDFLEKLSKNNDLYLVTNRQRKELVHSQIEKFDWTSFFKGLLITEGKKSKAELIRSMTEPLPCDVLIGDTGEDVKCARELDIHSIAVCWGILNKEVLSEYDPDFIAERIEDLDLCSFL